MESSTFLTDDLGVSKQIMEPGTGEMPNAKDSVKVHYEGFLLDDGTKFDSSYGRNAPLEFILGEGKVIKGWEIAVKSMRVGETCKVTCSSEYAYGERGRLSIIPPNATLQFIITLLSTEQSVDSPAYLIKRATDLKAQGNDFYKADDVASALTSYKEAKGYIARHDGVSKEDLDQMQALSVSILANMAACYVKTLDWKNTIDSCKEVLELDPYHVKSYYRIGQSYSAINDIEEAMRYVRLGLKNIPNEPSLGLLYQQLEQKYMVWKSRNKEKFSKLFASYSLSRYTLCNVRESHWVGGV